MGARYRKRSDPPVPGWVQARVTQLVARATEELSVSSSMRLAAYAHAIEMEWDVSSSSGPAADRDTPDGRTRRARGIPKRWGI